MQNVVPIRVADPQRSPESDEQEAPLEVQVRELQCRLARMERMMMKVRILCPIAGQVGDE